MAKQSVKIDGVEYKSRTAAGVALVLGGMRMCDASKKVGISQQTINANTPGKGLEKVRARRAIARILAIGKTGKRSVGEISKKVGISTSKVVSILKKANIAIVSAEMKAAALKAAKVAKVATKVPKAPKVVSPVVDPTAPVAVTTEAPVAA